MTGSDFVDSDDDDDDDAVVVVVVVVIGDRRQILIDVGEKDTNTGLS